MSSETFAGLCADCAHAKRLITKGGGTILFCRLSAGDERFAKYPRLPVQSCHGFNPEGLTIKE